MANNRKYFVNLYGNQPASHGSLGIPQSLWPPVEIAQRDPAVADALRLLGTQGDTWANLYNIFEIIRKDVGGEGEIRQNGWATKKSLSNFRQSSGDRRVSGDQARHGVPQGEPPSDPMALSEAASLIKSIFSGWLSWKEADQQPSD